MSEGKDVFFQSPYNFVPLPTAIYVPKWGEHVSHDLPFRDGVSGSIAFELTAETELMVGGARHKRSDDGYHVEFAVAPDASNGGDRRQEPPTPTIPGSAIRGMVRNVLEIASFSRMKLIHGARRQALRDLNNKVRAYTQVMVARRKVGGKEGFAPLVESGFLNFDRESGRWMLTPCKFWRISQDELSLSGKGSFKNKEPVPGAVKYRNKAFRQGRDYFVSAGEMVKTIAVGRERREVKIVLERCRLAGKGEGGAKGGTIVYTGQPGGGPKYLEFVFHSRDEARQIPMDPALFAATKAIHEEARKVQEGDDSLWTYWFSERQGRDVPVFWLPQQGRVRAFGMSMMFKLPAPRTVGEMVAAQGGKEPGDDLATVIFGRLGTDAEASIDSGLRGRVSFSPAIRTHKPITKASPDHPAGNGFLLNSPKPSWFPAYLRQERSDGSYSTWVDDDARLSGWKRYAPLKRSIPDRSAAAANKKKLVTTMGNIQAPGTVFRGVMRFHNLKPIELGALVWALCWGAPAGSSRRHSLGLGKPFGLGAVSVKLLPNDQETVLLANTGPAPTIDSCVQDYVAEMDDWASKRFDSQWGMTDTIRALLALAEPRDPEVGTGPYAAPEPKQFTYVKTARKRLRPPV